MCLSESFGIARSQVSAVQVLEFSLQALAVAKRWLDVELGNDPFLGCELIAGM